MWVNISRMKSLISPTFSILSAPNLARPSNPSCLPLYFAPFLRQNPNFLSPLRPSSSSFCMSSLPLNSVRCHASSQQPAISSSGEIHVIVGPMFAGKTTSLLRRIQLESQNGSFQAAPLESSCLVLDKTLKDLCYSGRLREAIGLLCCTGVPVEWQTYSLLLQECIHREVYEWGKRLHTHMVVFGFVLNEYLKTKLLILYAKAGQLGTACILFDKLQEKNLISWNAMIAGYVQKGLDDEGLNLYFKMRCNGVIPDQFTFASVLRACASLALLEHGKQAHGVMVKCVVRQNVVVNSALMDMYFKCSSPFDGHRVFSTSPDKNVITWTALISGYGQNGKIVEVFELFDKMIEEGLRPNYVTFLAVLSACSHGGLVDEGWKYFSLMKDYGIQPCGKHYAAMVDILGRAGRLEEAYRFVNSSPCKENSVVWGSLLGACRIHGNVKLLKLSAEKFFELEPQNPGKYVVLSNTYATYGLWENVAEVRGLMRDYGVKKDPGYSRIEVQNEIHFFFKGDNTHKDAENTYQMLNNLTGLLMDIGYIPDLSSYE